MTILCQGKKWGVASIASELTKGGLSQELAEGSLYLVETQFSAAAQRIGATVEWSTRFAEVSGEMEDLQFDLDELREIAIDEVLSRIV